MGDVAARMGAYAALVEALPPEVKEANAERLKALLAALSPEAEETNLLASVILQRQDWAEAARAHAKRAEALSDALTALRLHHGDDECNTDIRPWPAACDDANKAAALALLNP